MGLGRDKLEVWGQQIQTAINEIDKQQGPTVQHRVLSQSCLILCSPVNCNPPGSSVHGIFLARLLDWVAISTSRESSDPGIEPYSPALQADSFFFFFNYLFIYFIFTLQYCIGFAIYQHADSLPLSHWGSSQNTGSNIQYPIINHNRKEYKKECACICIFIHTHIYIYV